MQLDLRTKKQMKSIARQLVGSHLAHQTAEAATQHRQSERVLNMVSAGDSPAPVGDSPTGTAPSHVANRPFSLPRTVVSVPSGGSPDGTGGSPVLPETIFQTRSQAKCLVCLPSRSGLGKSRRFGPTARTAGWNL